MHLIKLLNRYRQDRSLVARHASIAVKLISDRGVGAFIEQARVSAGLKSKQPHRPIEKKQAPAARATPRNAQIVVARGRKRGTMLVVSHDAAVGGAPQVARVFAKWLLSATDFDVKFVLCRDGALRHEFEHIAPTFVISAHPKGSVAARLAEFAGREVCAILLNSVVSGSFLRHWQQATPVVAYIHELEKLLGRHEVELELIKHRAGHVVAGSGAVAEVLCGTYDFDLDRVSVVHGFIESIQPSDLNEAEKSAARRALGFDGDELLVTACGVAHWRKSPEIFVEVARRVLSAYDGRVRFVWVGGGPDEEECLRLIRQYGLEDRVSFTGYEPDISRYLKASNVFLLPSAEDPFPLVCLYAAIFHNPIICFRDAGGMPELVKRGAGRVVSFGDVEAMAQATIDYLRDVELRRHDALVGLEIVHNHHTVASAGPALLHWMREAAGLRPRVSVVVPNYNYDRFLDERLRSIWNQTFQDFEVLLLDDKSTDDSLRILNAWAERRPGTRVIANETNTGSPFAQWIRGMALARGDLVWIAEADDSCLPRLLEALIPAFDDRNVFLAYSKSVPVDESGKPLGDYEELYLNRIKPGRWSQSYIVTDHVEANFGLGIANCIPNASSVLLRPFKPEEEFASTVSSMRMCGDWLFYLRAMRGGSIAYHPEPLNLHRRHDATVTSKTEGSLRYFDEFKVIREYVHNTYRLDECARQKIEAFTRQDLERFGIENGQKKQIIASHLRDTRKSKPSVLFVCSDLSPGGGQLFMIRLANAWERSGGRAVLVDVGKFPQHDRVVDKISDRIPLLRATDLSLSEIVRQYDIDLVHSSIWWADKFVQDSVAELPEIPWVITMHGCHETLLDHPHVDTTFETRMEGMLRRVDAWVHTADKNRRVFASHPPPQELRIDNGVDRESTIQLTREMLGLNANSLVACLASRAIEEKGWRSALSAMRQCRAAGLDVELLLIGEGPVANELRLLGEPGLHLFGQVSNLQDYLDVADVLLLPTYFVGESFPLVVLEALACGKPVVTTDVGQIPEIIGRGQDSAGIVTPLVNGRPDVDALASALVSLTDPQRRARLAESALRRYADHYTIGTMVARYDSLYRACIDRRAVQRA